MTWGYFYCPYCRANRKSNSDLWSHDGDSVEWCCGKSECQEEHQKKLARERKISDIEAELARGQVESERLRAQIEENERKSQSNQKTENSSGNNCAVCEKFIETGETYYHFAGTPATNICVSCKPRFLLQVAAQEAILKGENVNVRFLNLPAEDKICLEAFQKIMKKEPVNIDNLTISDKDKQSLKQLQKQFPSSSQAAPNNNSSLIPPQNTSDVPKPLGIYKYASNCRSCQKQWEFTQVPPRCPSCQSCQIDVYDVNGFLQILPPDSRESNNPVSKNNGSLFESPVFWIGVLIVIIVLLIPYFIWRSRKIKEYKKMNKKVPWWF